MSEQEKKAQECIDSIINSNDTTEMKILRLEIFLTLFVIQGELNKLGNNPTEDVKKAITMIKKKIKKLKTS